MRVVVDFDLCESNALCMAAAPEVFEVRDDDLLYVLDENPPESAAREGRGRGADLSRSTPSPSRTEPGPRPARTTSGTSAPFAG